MLTGVLLENNVLNGLIGDFVIVGTKMEGNFNRYKTRSGIFMCLWLIVENASLLFAGEFPEIPAEHTGKKSNPGNVIATKTAKNRFFLSDIISHLSHVNKNPVLLSNPFVIPAAEEVSE
jgi:hypothetical protein